VAPFEVSPLHGVRARLLQLLALYAPGAESLRVWLHRWRGVTIGEGVFIGTDALVETLRPELIRIGDRVTVGIRATMIAHFKGSAAAERDPSRRFSIVVEDDAFIGPGAILLPGVTVGRGAVIAAGSVVTSSVAPLTMVQGNPARPIARCGIPLSVKTEPSAFYRYLEPLR
jgi:acetyltransferase-like isoleucine patch superfamily enzyme